MHMTQNLQHDEDMFEYETVPLAILREALMPIRILVVEDDETQWPLWESIIKSTYPLAEIEWETTEHGAEALLRRAAQTERGYSLVISDIFLEGPGTGIDLWNHFGDAASNFIFVSSFSMRKFDDLMSTMLNLHFGTPLYLQKPLSATLCREALRMAL